jgi:imidazoleglycerol phosphate dehydratase HisB
VALPGDKHHLVEDPAVSLGLGGQPIEHVAVTLDFEPCHLAVDDSYINPRAT